MSSCTTFDTFHAAAHIPVGGKRPPDEPSISNFKRHYGCSPHFRFNATEKLRFFLGVCAVWLHRRKNDRRKNE